MTPRSWLASASLRRTALEIGLLAFLLVLPLAAILRPSLELGLGATRILGPPVSRWPVLGIGMIYAGLLSAVLGAVRLRRSPSAGEPTIQYELSGALTAVFAIWTGALLANIAGGLAMLSGSLDRPAGFPLAISWLILAVASAVAGTFAYLFCRSVILAWPAWNRLRRTRLLWTLAHGLLVGSLVLVVGVAAILAVIIGADRFGPPFGPKVLPPDAGFAAVLLAWVVTRLLPTASWLLVAGVVASMIVLPPAVLISYLVLRRPTRRLEELAAATEALRRGDLAARVSDEGEDEVGRLQTDFNAMATDLERTLHDLQEERDRVAGLLEARRHLVAAVSHELRTPVATVRGYLESILGRDKALSAELRTDLETMELEVKRLQRLIEDLFTLSRAEVGRLDLRLGPADVGTVVRRLVDARAPLAWQQRRVQLLAEIDTGLPPARVDTERLEQVMSNLVSNAVRHTPPGGLVIAAVTAELATIRVDVKDTGEGIPPDELPHIFERFYRGPSDKDIRRDGAGLGLALVKELAEAMGGSVEAASVSGEGSRFTVRLPRG